MKLTESTIFNKEDAPVTPEVAPVVATPTAPVIPQELAELVGEGKKYSTVEAALASVPHAQTHIASIEAQLAKANEALAAARTQEEILAEIRESSSSTVPTTPSAPTVSQEQITSLIKQSLKEVQTEKEATTNISTVTSTFEETFGDKAEAAYNQIATDSGLSIKDLNRLAATSPSAVLKLAGIGNKQLPVVKPSSGTINTESLAAQPITQEHNSRVSGNTTKDLTAAFQKAKNFVAAQH